ncbi:phage tail protein [Brevundimonas sp.]|uniref:phage tail protein n=1 Tax=Brevundimonas sp. TaxID=1871086 RepID=UPI0028AB1456|nr:phage tail protein [Brevundimonas sp.]
MGKALKTVGVIIGGAALIATGVGALAMPALAGSTTLFGVSVGTLNTISSGLVAVGGMLDKPKSQGSAAPDEWTSNPDQPIPFLMGRMGVAGKIVQRDEFGPDNMYQGIVGIISGAGPIRGVNGFAGDKQAVTFGANGIAVTSQWEGEMWMVRRAGNQPDTALAVPTGLKSGGATFEWSAAARLSGKACYLQVLGENSKGTAYPAGIPDPVHDAEGIFGYDPRYDSTYPGGAGPCRLGVRSTYRWINDGGIGALNWALGLVENGQVVGGIGASIDGIDVPAFVEVANIADANGWTLSAWPDTSEDASAVLDQLLQAAGAVRARHAGKISCVSRGAPRASVATITARDTAGDIELDTAPSLFNRLNTITPRFMSEAAGWVMTPANPVSFPQYVTDDGGKHGDQIDYRFVSSLKQAAELAAYDILDAREPFSGTIPLKAHMRHLKRGDTFDIDEPGFLMDGVKCIVLSRSYDPKTAQVRLGFRSETDSKHPLALGKTTTLPVFPVLTPTDPTFVTPPLPGDWVITPRPPSGGGTQQPGFDLTGLVSNATATAVIVEWGSTADGPWTQAYAGPPDVTSIPIVGLQSGATYFIAVRYQRNSNFSDRYVYGPYVAPDLIAGDVIKVGGETAAEIATGISQIREIGLGAVANAAQALADMQEQLSEGMLSLALGHEQLNRWQNELSWINGEKLGTYAERRTTELYDGQTAIVEDISLIGARTLDGEGWLLRADTVMVSPTETLVSALVRMEAETDTALATALSEISLVAGDLSAEITARELLAGVVADNRADYLAETQLLVDDLSAEIIARELLAIEVGENAGAIVTERNLRIDEDEALASLINALSLDFDGQQASITTLLSITGDLENGLEAMFGLVLDVDGYAVGVQAGNNGETGALKLLFDELAFVDPDGGDPIFVIAYGVDNILRLQNVVIQNASVIGDLVVRGEAIQRDVVTPLTATYAAASISLNGTTRTTVAEVVVATTGKQLNIRFNGLIDTRHEPASSYTLFVELRRQTASGVGDLQIDYGSVDAPGNTADNIVAKWPIDVLDRPSAGTYRYYVDVWTSATDMTVQAVRQRFMSAMELRTNS